MINLTYAYYTIASSIGLALLFIAGWLVWNSKPVIDMRVRFHGRPAALKKAVRKASSLHHKTGKRYRVFFLGMRYRVYDRDMIKERKKSGIFNRYINSTSIDCVKHFDTNDIQPCS